MSMNWLQFVQRYPKMSAENAAVFAGVPVHRAKSEIENARRILRKPLDHRTSGSRKIACKIVRIPLRTVKVSEAHPDPRSTKRFLELNATNLNVRRESGVLEGPIDADTLQMLPSDETMVEPDSLGKQLVDTHEYVQHNPGCLELLPRSLTQRVQAMSLDDRIEVGDLSLTKGDMGQMTAMQRELAARRNAVEAKAA